jgi:N-acetylneuraminic acid mutarotase
MRAARIGGGAFIAGGIDADDPIAPRSTARFERYDFSRHVYTSLPPLPLALNHLGMVAVGGDIYVIGGFGESPDGIVASKRGFRYRVRARRWEELPPMRYARGAHVLAAIGPRIYAIGGKNLPGNQDASPEVAQVESFDTRTQKWSTRASMPTPRDHLGVAVYRGQIYALGGRLADQSALTRLDRYDPRTNRWVKVADAPVPISGMVLTAVRGLLVAAGGEDPNAGHIYGSVWAFDPVRRKWRSLPPLPTPVHGYAGVGTAKRVYVFGGSTCPGFHPTPKSYSLPVPSQ